MAKYIFEMSWNYDEREYRQFLKDYKLTHLKTHNEEYFKVGDALRSENGIIARIVHKFNNYENCSHDYTIANVKVSVDEMYDNFGNDDIRGRLNHELNNQLHTKGEELRWVSPEVGYVDKDEEYY